MKVEDLYSIDKDSQVGVTFQRHPFETQVDIFPEVSPLREAAGVQDSGEPVESALTSVQMEELVCRAVKHQDLEEFQPIPVKMVEGPEHKNQEVQEGNARKEVRPERSRHEELLEEIDAGDEIVTGNVKVKKDKKEGTLTRMKEKLKSMRREKEEKCDDGKPPTKSLSKIFQRIKPVGKVSRENFSRVFHKIGDALQKKDEEDKEESKEGNGEDKIMSLERKDVEKKLRHHDQRT